MKKIVIIAAMDEELEAIQNKFENVEERKLKRLGILWGDRQKGKRICFNKKCGVGRNENSARVTQMLIDNFDIEYIMNVGIARVFKWWTWNWDIDIGKKLVQHDFWYNSIWTEKGYITDTEGSSKAMII